MAPSSLKKMSGGTDWTEGNYASLNRGRLSPVGLTYGDPGLTLLPGLQIQTEAETNKLCDPTPISRSSDPVAREGKEHTSQRKWSERTVKTIKRSWTPAFPPPKSHSPFCMRPASRKSRLEQPRAKTGRRFHASSRKILKTARNLLQSYSEPTTRHPTVEGDVTTRQDSEPILYDLNWDLSPTMDATYILGGDEDWLGDSKNQEGNTRPSIMELSNDLICRTDKKSDQSDTATADRRAIYDSESLTIKPPRIPVEEETLEDFAERVFGQSISEQDEALIREEVTSEEVPSERPRSEEMPNEFIDEELAREMEDWRSWMPADLSLEFGF